MKLRLIFLNYQPLHESILPNFHQKILQKIIIKIYLFISYCFLINIVLLHFVLYILVFLLFIQLNHSFELLLFLFALLNLFYP